MSSGGGPHYDAVRVATNAMRVRFEILMHGADPSRLRAAGEQALSVIHEVEDDLSPYRPTSDIYRINAAEVDEPVRVQASTLRFLSACQERQRQSGGAFDPTIGPLLELWGLKGNTILDRKPTDTDVLTALESIGMDRLITIDPDTQSVAWTAPGGRLDPGAAGKGWAVDRATELLADLGVEDALVHGGTSSIRVIGGPYPIRIAEGPISDIELTNKALGISGAHGSGIVIDGTHFGHVVNPNTGHPVDYRRGSAVTAGSAFDADTWSTALMVAPHLDQAKTGANDEWSGWSW